MNVKKTIDDLRVFAKANNFRIVFRDHKTNCGDFCIFIYNAKKGGRYLIGYDGYWNSKYYELTSFEYCVTSAYNYIARIV